MNKTIAQASLDNLYDIIIPDPIGLFPLAPGWIVLILLFVTLVFHFSWQKYLAYRKELYRREALQELLTLKDTLSLLNLAKRTAIAAYGRESVATLSDDRWWDFMQAESKSEIAPPLRKELKQFLYSDKRLDDKAYHALFSVVETWIKTHKGVPSV